MICFQVLLLLSMSSLQIMAFLLSPPFTRIAEIPSPLHRLEGESSPNDEIPSSLKGFNPWDYATRTNISPDSILRGEKRELQRNVVSLRQNRMQQLTSDLLNAAPNENLMQSILQENKEFLLEPLEDSDAVQDVDSIYLKCKDRQERYRAFERSMDERLASAKNPLVLQVLKAMKEFVLACETRD